MRTAVVVWLMPLTLSAQVDPPEHSPDPCALPPVTFDLTGDSVEDVAVVGYADGMKETEPPEGGVCQRAVGMLPGTTLLLAFNAEGYWDVFVPKAGEALTSERLATDLSAGRMRWSIGSVNVLYLGYGTNDQTITWRYHERRTWERLVFRTASTDGAVIGMMVISATLPLGEVSVQSTSVVREGQVWEFWNVALFAKPDLTELTPPRATA
jgi:hypothetical protein